MYRPSFLFPLLALWALAAVLAACAPVSPSPALVLSPTVTVPRMTATATNTPVPIELPVTASPSPLPTGFSLPASPNPTTLPYDFPKAGTVVLDFVALACQARWANGASELPCPGDMADLLDGFIAPAEQAAAEGNIDMEAPLLIGLPGSGGAGHGAGLFGIYPPLPIQPGDSFHATLACHEAYNCNVEFALEYLDAAGKIHHDTGWSVNHTYGGGPVPLRFDLSPLAGQTVQLVLAVRDLGTPEDDWFLLIYSYVERLGP